MLTTLAFVALLGTYLDLIFVGQQMYAFPVRPFPDIFSINVAVPLLVLPVMTAVYLKLTKRMRTLTKIIFTLLIGVIAGLTEPIAERLGFFIHAPAWNHMYSFIGYTCFLFFIDWIYRRLL